VAWEGDSWEFLSCDPWGEVGKQLGRVCMQKRKFHSLSISMKSMQCHFPWKLLRKVAVGHAYSIHHRVCRLNMYTVWTCNNERSLKTLHIIYAFITMYYSSNVSKTPRGKIKHHKSTKPCRVSANS